MTPYRTAARKNVFDKRVSFEPFHIIPSSPVKHSPNGIRNMNQPFSSSHSTDNKILEGIDIEDNYRKIGAFGKIIHHGL